MIQMMMSTIGGSPCRTQRARQQRALCCAQGSGIRDRLRADYAVIVAQALQHALGAALMRSQLPGAASGTRRTNARILLS